MTDALAPMIQTVELQAAVCARWGSPFAAAVARAVAADIAAGGAFADLSQPWLGQDVRALLDEATPLRFLGGLHALVLAGDAPDLARLYPSAAPHPGAAQRSEPDPARLAALVAATAREHRAMLTDFVTSPPQTNEVNRAVCLAAGFLVIAARAGLPLRCLEIGASAGLNLNWDRFRYDLGEAGAWGDPASPVRLAAEWTGAPPPYRQAVTVAERRGCDQNPIDIRQDAAARRLRAYVWPDQFERMARLDGAIDVARRHPPIVEKADAGAWARDHARPAAGAATVLYHSVVWSYLPAQVQDQIKAAVAAAGESATQAAPFAWLRMEPNPRDMAAPMELKLTFWPGGGESLLAHVHPHGVQVSWTGD